MGHEKVAPLPFCTCPCYCMNFCIYAMLRTRATIRGPPRGWATKSSPGPEHSVNTEINTVARTRAKQKAGYFFVAHPVWTDGMRYGNKWLYV